MIVELDTNKLLVGPLSGGVHMRSPFCQIAAEQKKAITGGILDDKSWPSGGVAGGQEPLSTLWLHGFI